MAYMATPRPAGPNFMLRAALNGFDAARERFAATSVANAPPEDAFVPLTETLWWTVTVDDGFADLAGSGSGYRPNLGDYKNARSKDPSGRVFLALRYARDRCGHQRALVAVEDELRFPFIILDVSVLGPFFRWRPSAQLPPAPPKFPSAKLQPEYDNCLAGHPVSQALDAAAKWFAQERQRACV